MLKLKSLLLGSMFGLLVVSAALAQVTIDVSKITCDQYVLDQVTDFRTITAWLDGFYSGRRNNTVIDVQALERIADKVEEYCRSHRDMALMQAVETTLGGGDRALVPRSKPRLRLQSPADDARPIVRVAGVPLRLPLITEMANGDAVGRDCRQSRPA